MIHVPTVGDMELGWDMLGLVGWEDGEEVRLKAREQQGVVGRGEVGEGGEVWDEKSQGHRWVWQRTGGCGRKQVGVAGTGGFGMTREGMTT